MIVERLTRCDCRISRLWDVNDDAERVVLFDPTKARNRGPARHRDQSALVVAAGCTVPGKGAATRPYACAVLSPLILASATRTPELLFPSGSGSCRSGRIISGGECALQVYFQRGQTLVIAKLPQR